MSTVRHVPPRPRRETRDASRGFATLPSLASSGAQRGVGLVGPPPRALDWSGLRRCAGHEEGRGGRRRPARPPPASSMREQVGGGPPARRIWGRRWRRRGRGGGRRPEPREEGPLLRRALHPLPSGGAPSPAELEGGGATRRKEGGGRREEQGGADLSRGWADPAAAAALRNSPPSRRSWRRGGPAAWEGGREGEGARARVQGAADLTVGGFVPEVELRIEAWGRLDHEHRRHEKW